ncbi:unnamed protein product [Onchocerca ochengi]|uniref:Uncharacterized protein n=1 Tax=Onchocerca ochengi TaxID=42157 RepID=A0A182DWN9_ONCOC|nr:unnamed protein product [Onchocerca ochengi]
MTFKTECHGDGKDSDALEMGDQQEWNRLELFGGEGELVVPQKEILSSPGSIDALRQEQQHMTNTLTKLTRHMNESPQDMLSFRRQPKMERKRRMDEVWYVMVWYRVVRRPMSIPGWHNNIGHYGRLSFLPLACVVYLSKAK